LLASNSETTYFYIAASINEQIGGFDVTMNHLPLVQKSEST
jgi:hypothetical protein